MINKEVNARTATAQLIMFPENKFSLLYSVGIGVTQENKFFAHFPLGCFFAGYLFGYSDGENNDLLTSLAILSVVIPEGICYNLNIGNQLRVSPYINFNSVEYYRVVGGDEKIKPSCELGSKISYFSKNNIGCSFFLGSKLLSASGLSVHAGASVFFCYWWTEFVQWINYLYYF